jgi:hypothetical protein
MQPHDFFCMQNINCFPYFYRPKNEGKIRKVNKLDWILITFLISNKEINLDLSN